MNFTVSTIAKSLAGYLAPVLPGVTYYEDPNKQGTKTPCLFLQTRYTRLEHETGGYWRRILGLDLTYLVDYNMPNMQQLYEAAAEALDLVMETFPYSDGAADGSVLLRTYDREWNIDLDALHYRFELRERVTLPETFQPMETMDYNGEVTNGETV